MSEGKRIIKLGKVRGGLRPYKITLSKTRDNNLKIELEGGDPLSTALLLGGLQVVKALSKKLIDTIEEIGKRNLPKSQGGEL